MTTKIDETGLHRDRLDVIFENFKAKWRSIYGDGIDVGTTSTDGQALGANAEATDVIGQLLEDVFLSRSPSNARGAQLSRLVQLNGITRKEASYSTASITVTGTPGTLIPAGSLIDTTSTPSAHFKTVNDITLASDGTGGGTVQATTTGAVQADTGAISVIKTVVSGWATASNPTPAIIGSDRETDAALRVRRALSVALPSRSLVDGIYAALTNIPGVSEAKVHENKTGFPIVRAGGDPLPPNSIQAIVAGGADADIAKAIWVHASAGVTLVGATSQVVVDSQGVGQIIKFDRPQSALVYARVFLRISLGVTLTQSTIDLIKTTLVNYGNSVSHIGKPVTYGSLFAPVDAALTAAFGGDPNAVSVFLFNLGLTPPGLIQTDMAIPFNAKAVWDVSRVTVSYIPSDPL